MLETLKKDIRLIINIKKQVLIGLAFLLIFLLFSTIFNGFMEEQRLIDHVHIGIVDQEDSKLSRMLVGHFKTNEEFMSLFTVTVADDQTIQQMYDTDELSAIIYIPENFTNSLRRFKNTPLHITLNANYPLQNTVLENIMHSYSTYIKAVDVGIYSLHEVLEAEGIADADLNRINESFSVNMVLTALGRNEIFDHKVIETFPSATSDAYFIYSIVLLMIIFVASSGASMVSDELKTMCLQRLKTSPHTYIKFASSKIIVMYLNLLILLIPVMLALKTLQPSLGMAYTFYLFLFLSLVTLFFIILSVTIGLVVPKNDISALVTTMTTLVLGILGGHFIPIQVMPKFIQDLSSFTPNYWMLRSCLFLNNQSLPSEFMWTCLLIGAASLIMVVVQHILYQRGALWEK